LFDLKKGANWKRLAPFFVCDKVKLNNKKEFYFVVIEIRKCEVTDVDEVIPLMYSSGPESFRYVFSVDYEFQAIDFLHYAFCSGSGEFGYKGHQVVIENDQIVALVGRRAAQENLAYTVAALKQIITFYPFFKALGVLIRGLRFEAIVKPPVKDVICLHNLAVREDQQGSGIGEKLITNFLAQEKGNGKKTVSLNVAETNPKARKLYKRLGFIVKNNQLGNLQGKYGRGVSHEYMEIDL
jgi:ribosomal protein S18 acetylase RimI-like enzyme